MDDKLIVEQLQNELPVWAHPFTSFDDLKEKWASYFNSLIQSDFPKLVSLFYRIDISEDKIRKILKENPEGNAGVMITSLVIERLLQKIKTREAFHSKPKGFSDDPHAEKW